MKNKNKYWPNIALAFSLAVGAFTTHSASAIPPPTTEIIPLDVDLTYQCYFPILSQQPINLKLTSEAPATLFIGEQLEYQINAEIEFNEVFVEGLGLVEATQLSGVFDPQLSLHVDHEVIPLPLSLELEPTQFPVDIEPMIVKAKGMSETLTIEQNFVGELVALSAGENITLSLEATIQNGSPAPHPLDRFNGDCQLTEPVGQSLTAEPSAVDFRENVSGTKLSKRINIRNSTSYTAYISELIIEGEDSSVFVFGDGGFNDCDELAPTQSCQVRVVYSPVDIGVDNASVNVVSNLGTTDIPLTGTSVMEAINQFKVSPVNVDFGRVAPGERVEKEIVITNLGPAISGYGFKRIDDINWVPGFTFSVRSCFGMGVGDTCTIEVSYTSSGYKDSIVEQTIYIEPDDPKSEAIPVQLSADAREPSACLPVVEQYAIVGEATLGVEQTKVSFIGKLEGGPACPEPAFNASVYFQPVPVKIPTFELLADNISMNLLWVPEPTFELTGTETEAGVSVQGEFQVLVHDVYISLFGLVKIPFGGGDDCHPAEPVAIQLNSNYAQGSLDGTMDIGPFENCGLATAWINRRLSGAGNPVSFRPQ